MHRSLKNPTITGTVEKHSIIRRPIAHNVKKKSTVTSARPMAECYMLLLITHQDIVEVFKDEVYYIYLL